VVGLFISRAPSSSSSRFALSYTDLGCAFRACPGVERFPAAQAPYLEKPHSQTGGCGRDGVLFEPQKTPGHRSTPRRRSPVVKMQDSRSPFPSAVTLSSIRPAGRACEPPGWSLSRTFSTRKHPRTTLAYRSPLPPRRRLPGSTPRRSPTTAPIPRPCRAIRPSASITILYITIQNYTTGPQAGPSDQVVAIPVGFDEAPSDIVGTA